SVSRTPPTPTLFPYTTLFRSDRFPERLRMAREKAGAVPLNYAEVDVYDALMDITGGRGPDHCIDAVGLEGHACGLTGLYDRAKRSEEHTSELQSRGHLVCRLL